MTPSAIRLHQLTKSYGARTVLDHVDLDVPAGTVLGLLGPNGAGKTTAVRILTTLLRPDSGTAEVAGHDVLRSPHEVRRNIGLVGQSAALDEVLGARQNLVMFGRLHHLGVRAARVRADELLDAFRLADTGDKAVRDFSGGMRRRLDLAASLLLAPPVLFLDEPTTGLDPQGRLDVWAAVRTLVGDGTTVLLTTQHLDEADRLAHRVCVLDAGRVVALGTPTELKSATGGDRIDVVLADAADLPHAAALVARALGAPPGDVDTDVAARRVTAPVADRMGALAAVVAALTPAGLAVDDLGLRRPTLDEAYLRLTGHTAQPDAAAQAGPTAPGGTGTTRTTEEAA
ncbi:ATP-binding cassette domain-containing protein [Cellulomonas cellasea]|uniref:ABC-2 type transport system ATP-binding protein n=1 Tax=Cellulomonas cellasea TaxID=43670 RepID=A0A7W4UGL7_9CELL|nr:ATP-binding cassette domain-containing protein [Cellulomonas cellasea]MBB2923818.1 ABC-2 type transport system ATP-binding protein [Cellulomonas cellasea]